MIQRFHTYELVFSNLAAGAGSEVAGTSQQDSFLVDTLYDFWWFKAQAFVSVFATGVGVSPDVQTMWPLITVLLQDGASQQQLANRAVALGNIFGNGRIPYILPQPHVIAGGASFNATVTNLGTTAYTVRLAFSGVHVARGQRPVSRVRRQMTQRTA